MFATAGTASPILYGALATGAFSGLKSVVELSNDRKDLTRTDVLHATIDAGIAATTFAVSKGVGKYAKSLSSVQSDVAKAATAVTLDSAKEFYNKGSVSAETIAVALISSYAGGKTADGLVSKNLTKTVSNTCKEAIKKSMKFGVKESVHSVATPTHHESRPEHKQ